MRICPPKTQKKPTIGCRVGLARSRKSLYYGHATDSLRDNRLGINNPKMSLAPILACSNVLVTPRTCSDDCGVGCHRVFLVRELAWIHVIHGSSSDNWHLLPSWCNNLTDNHLGRQIRRRTNIPARRTNPVEHSNAFRIVCDCTHDGFIHLIDLPAGFVQTKCPFGVPIKHGESFEVNTLETSNAVNQISFGKRAEFELKSGVDCLVGKVEEAAVVPQLLDLSTCQLKFPGFISQ